MRLLKLLFILTILLSCSEKEKYVNYVDPFIGSVHARWFFFTPASHPFGMAKLAPHTNAYGQTGGWTPCGFDYRHESIEGFGHFHEFQVGALVTMPIVGKIKTLPGTLENPDKGYRSRFNKKTQKASPGYYSVFLDDYKVKAEITATPRVGIHRYTFPKSDNAHILFDIGHSLGESGKIVNSSIQVKDNSVYGWIETYPVYATFCQPNAHIKHFFYAKVDKKINSVDSFIDDKLKKNNKQNEGVGAGIVLNFKTEEAEELIMKVGLSYTSIENAKNNLLVEARNLSFEEAKLLAENSWEEKLSRIQVEGKSKENKVKFYTALYHALLGRGLSSDVNGDYITFNKTIKKAKFNHYNTDGIWGGFWNLTQVWALAYPEYYKNYIQSNIDFYKDSGWLHDGEACGVFTNGVQTNFQALIMASAYNCGIRDFDVETGYKACIKNELEFKGRNPGNGKYDLKYFIKRGYIPEYETKYPNGWILKFGASHTLEYSFSSYAVAQFAKQLGKEKDYKKLMKYAYSYENLFDKETKFIRPREMDAQFIEPFDPMKAWEGFQEGNAFQYTWYVPHNPAGLIKLIGKDLFNKRLTNMFINAEKSCFGGGKEIDSFSGIEKLYNHGNQPCLFNSYLFNYSSKPWLTQKWTREICKQFYGTTPTHGYGYGQDEDQGQLGAWYVMSSIGLFDVKGHTDLRPSFQITSPVFDKITVKLHPKYYKAKKLIISTKNNSLKNRYIQKAYLNGNKLVNSWFYRDLINESIELKLELGDKPNKDWGVQTPPPSL
jgi:predicted alpha-1,2-mannosidase